MSKSFNLIAVLLLHILLIQADLIVLDWKDNPQYIIRFSSDQINTKQIQTSIPTKFKFSIQLVKMKTSRCDSGTDHPSVSLIPIPGEKSYFCTNYDNAGGNFKWVQHTYNYDKLVEVEASGTWGPQDEATLVATIYQDVHTCSDCPANSFCCEGGSGSCEGSTVEGVNQQPRSNLSYSIVPESTRCIPNHLKCNKYPNCGKSCNADERKEDCGEYGGGGASLQVGAISMALGFIGALYFTF